MKKIYILLIASLIFSVFIDKNSANPLDRISNGQNASLTYYFACNILVINIGNQSVHFGGGTIITYRHVLTSASLIAGKGNSYRIDYRIPNNINFEHLSAYIAVSHNEFNPKTLQNDIAIIFLPLRFKQFHTDGSLKMGGFGNVPKTVSRLNAAVVGHGYTSAMDPEMSRIPYFANITTDGTTNSCQKTASTLFCSFGSNAGILCEGDEGSGVFTHINGNGKAILVGVISSIQNKSCVYNGNALYSQYTAVGLYEEWIQTVTGINYQ